jgi:glycosyltransferase involved in cell wall biosynthesis
MRSVASVAKQDFEPNEFEIVIVENGGRQGAEAIVDEIRRNFQRVTIRYVHEPAPGLLAGRHRGLQEASRDLLVFIDDDIEATPHWLNAIAESFVDPNVHLVGGRNFPEYESAPPGWLDAQWQNCDGGIMCTHLSLSDLGPIARPIDANLIWGLNFSIRKRSLLELGGFHPDGVPPSLLRFRGDGETGLTMAAKALGYGARYNPLAVIKHIVPSERLTQEYFAKRSYAQGISDSYTKTRHRATNQSEKALQPRALPMTSWTLPQRIWGRLRRVGSSASRFSRAAGEVQAWAPLPEAGDGLQAAMDAAYEAGYQFHQDCVRNDPALLHWVTRSHYWDYRIPSEQGPGQN